MFLSHGNLQHGVSLVQLVNSHAKVVRLHLCAAAVDSLQDSVVNKHVLILSHSRVGKGKILTIFNREETKMDISFDKNTQLIMLTSFIQDCVIS